MESGKVPSASSCVDKLVRSGAPTNVGGKRKSVGKATRSGVPATNEVGTESAKCDYKK